MECLILTHCGYICDMYNGVAVIYINQSIHISEEFVGMEYCPFDTFSAQCDAEEVIMMKHARYGAMRIGKCIEASIGTLYIPFFITSEECYYSSLIFIHKHVILHVLGKCKCQLSYS